MQFRCPIEEVFPVDVVGIIGEYLIGEQYETHRLRMRDLDAIFFVFNHAHDNSGQIVPTDPDLVEALPPHLAGQVHSLMAKSTPQANGSHYCNTISKDGSLEFSWTLFPGIRLSHVEVLQRIRGSSFWPLIHESTIMQTPDGTIEWEYSLY